jgi:hypothetical protein
MGMLCTLAPSQKKSLSLQRRQYPTSYNVSETDIYKQFSSPSYVNHASTI